MEINFMEILKMSNNWEEQLKTIWETTKEGKVYGLSNIEEITDVFTKWNDIKQSTDIKELRNYIGMECANIGLGSIGRNNGTRKVDEQIWRDIKELLNKITENNNQDIDKLIQDNKGLENYKSAKQFLFKTITLELCTNYPEEDVLFITDEQTINRLLSLLQIEKKDLNFFQKCKKIMEATKECMPKDDKIKQQFEYNVRRSAALWYLGSETKVDDFPTDDQPNVIFYGPPGTGKTYLVKNMIDLVCQGNTSRYEWVQFHPSYTYEDFIEGIKPTGITENGSVKLELVNGIFKELCIRAKNDPEHKYYFIADEINRANLSAVFGEVLSCIEPSYRDTNENHNLIKTQYSTIETKIINEQLETAKDDKKKEQIKKKVYFYDENTKETKFGIPSNVYFIGMMNDVDKSIDSFDLALRRRFKWIRKDCDTEVVRDFLNEEDIKEESIEKYIKSIVSLNKFISDELKLGKSYEFGHSFFMKITYNKKNKEIEDEHKKNLFENYLKPTLTEYLRSLYDNEEVLKTNLDIARDKFVKEE